MLFQRKVHKNVLASLYCKLDPEIGQSTIGTYQNNEANEIDSSIIPEISVVEALMKPMRYYCNGQLSPEKLNPVLVIWHISFDKEELEHLNHSDGQSFLVFFNRRKDLFYQMENPISEAQTAEQVLALVLKQKEGNENQTKMPKYTTNAFRDKDQDVYLIYWGEEAFYLIKLSADIIHKNKHNFILTTEYPAPVLFVKPTEIEKFRYEI